MPDNEFWDLSFARIDYGAFGILELRVAGSAGCELQYRVTGHPGGQYDRWQARSWLSRSEHRTGPDIAVP